MLFGTHLLCQALAYGGSEDADGPWFMSQGDLLACSGSESVQMVVGES